jgi:hypothetical protein
MTVDISGGEYEEDWEGEDGEDGVLPDMKALLVSRDKLECKVFSFLLFSAYEYPASI